MKVALIYLFAAACHAIPLSDTNTTASQSQTLAWWSFVGETPTRTPWEQFVEIVTFILLIMLVFFTLIGIGFAYTLGGGGGRGRGGGLGLGGTATYMALNSLS